MLRWHRDMLINSASVVIAPDFLTFAFRWEKWPDQRNNKNTSFLDVGEAHVFVHSDVGTSFERKKESMLFGISLLQLQGRDFYAFTMPHENTIQAGVWCAKSTVIFHLKHYKNTQVVTNSCRILVVPLLLLVPPADFVSLSCFCLYVWMIVSVRLPGWWQICFPSWEVQLPQSAKYLYIFIIIYNI